MPRLRCRAVYGVAERESQDTGRYVAYTGVFTYLTLVLKVFSFSC